MLSILKNVLTVLDILVVAYIFYKVFTLIRGTRAVQALKGLGILVAISFIASFGRLETLDWLLRKFWTWGAVALIIIFAPEFKSALARMGTTAAFLSGSQPDERAHIRKVVEAVERLSSMSTGALIVMA
ncbi:TIGR00159 family protein, partial [Candidatus Poribacteria bacterium]|nr:TIGR00159 family protein [Candidatus Poribacteria bacterium]